jgi:ribonuclease R
VKERIAEFIREKAYRPMTFAELAAALGITEKQQQQLQKTVEQMESTGEVVRTRLDRFGAPERMNLAVGRLQGHPKGFGFLIPDDREASDVFIGRESLNGAWHGDRIVARLSPPGRADGRVEGEIIRILHRANQRVVGTFESARNGGYITPDDRRLADDIFVPKGATNGAKSSEKVVVQVVTWPEARRNAEGKVVERIGMKGQVGVDIVSVIRKFDLPEAFPGKVLQEAEAVPETVTAEAIAEPGRRDLRSWQIVTIDGEDAKDLDDAVNVERIGDGVWRLGVHVADVSYYVKEISALDRDAYQRATSVYLADRVVPMLPPRLSNGICSLNPQVDRLTLSCVMEINAEGKVLRYEIFPSVIKTVARMTYTAVNDILNGEPQAIEAYKGLVPTFREMLTLMDVLRTKRNRRGSLDFDLPEAKVRLNEEGWPVEIRRVERGVAERLIEEFMLAANETVAQHCSSKEMPTMYRIHGEPSADRLQALRDFLQLFGYNLSVPREGAITPKQLQAVTDWSRGRPEENLVNSVLLRTMRQAVYSEQNQGHFGLAADHYCHFTSPIRRYPDLVVHRVLRAMLSGGVNAKLRSKWERWMPEAARHSSDRERVAVEAERETLDLKKAEFMSDKVDQTYEGIISGVSSFGFFVQLPNTVEGLVHVSSLTDDYYHFHDRFYALIGERTRRRLRLGDPVVVRVNRVDVDSRQVDFTLVLEQTPAITVEAVPGETRNRAGVKRSLSAVIPRVQAEPQIAPETVSETTPEAAGKRKRRKPRRGGAGKEEATAVIETATAPQGPDRAPNRSAKAMEPPVKAPEPSVKATATSVAAASPIKPTETPKRSERSRPPVPPATRKDRVERVESPPTRSSKLDMWGVPVPEGRVNRPRFDDDPGVINPFSVTVSRNDKGSRGRSPFAGPKPTAPATADESAGLPTDAAAKRPRSRRPQRSRSAANTQPSKPKE